MDNQKGFSALEDYVSEFTIEEDEIEMEISDDEDDKTNGDDFAKPGESEGPFFGSDPGLLTQYNPNEDYDSEKCDISIDEEQYEDDNGERLQPTKCLEIDLECSLSKEERDSMQYEEENNCNLSLDENSDHLTGSNELSNVNTSAGLSDNNLTESAQGLLTPYPNYTNCSSDIDKSFVLTNAHKEKMSDANILESANFQVGNGYESSSEVTCNGSEEKPHDENVLYTEMPKIGNEHNLHLEITKNNKDEVIERNFLSCKENIRKEDIECNSPRDFRKDFDLSNTCPSTSMCEHDTGKDESSLEVACKEHKKSSHDQKNIPLSSGLNKNNNTDREVDRSGTYIENLESSLGFTEPNDFSACDKSLGEVSLKPLVKVNNNYSSTGTNLESLEDERKTTCESIVPELENTLGDLFQTNNENGDGAIVKNLESTNGFTDSSFCSVGSSNLCEKVGIETSPQESLSVYKKETGDLPSQQSTIQKIQPPKSSASEINNDKLHVQNSSVSPSYTKVGTNTSVIMSVQSNSSEKQHSSETPIFTCNSYYEKSTSDYNSFDLNNNRKNHEEDLKSDKYLISTEDANTSENLTMQLSAQNDGCNSPAGNEGTSSSFQKKNMSFGKASLKPDSSTTVQDECKNSDQRTTIIHSELSKSNHTSNDECENNSDLKSIYEANTSSTVKSCDLKETREFFQNTLERQVKNHDQSSNKGHIRFNNEIQPKVDLEMMACTDENIHLVHNEINNLPPSQYSNYPKEDETENKASFEKLSIQNPDKYAEEGYVKCMHSKVQKEQEMDLGAGSNVLDNLQKDDQTADIENTSQILPENNSPKVNESQIESDDKRIYNNEEANNNDSSGINDLNNNSKNGEVTVLSSTNNQSESNTLIVNDSVDGFEKYHSHAPSIMSHTPTIQIQNELFSYQRDHLNKPNSEFENNSEEKIKVKNLSTTPLSQNLLEPREISLISAMKASSKLGYIDASKSSKEDEINSDCEGSVLNSSSQQKSMNICNVNDDTNKSTTEPLQESKTIFESQGKNEDICTVKESAMVDSSKSTGIKKTDLILSRNDVPDRSLHSMEESLIDTSKETELTLQSHDICQGKVSNLKKSNVEDKELNTMLVHENVIEAPNSNESGSRIKNLMKNENGEEGKLNFEWIQSKRMMNMKTKSFMSKNVDNDKEVQLFTNVDLSDQAQLSGNRALHHHKITKGQETLTNEDEDFFENDDSKLDKKKVNSSKDLNTNVEDLLTDTQSWDEKEPSGSTFKRILKGTICADTEEKVEAHNQYFEEEKRGEELSQSQGTKELLHKLQTFSKVDVSKVADHILMLPSEEMACMEKEVASLTKRNSNLSKENLKIKKENETIKEELKQMKIQLHMKTNLCDEMKKQLVRIQPLLDAAIQVSNVNRSSNKDSIRKKKSSELSTPKRTRPKKQILDEESDSESDEGTPRKILNFNTPVSDKKEKHQAALVSISSRKKSNKEQSHEELRQKEEILQKEVDLSKSVSFKHIWTFLQEHGWRHRTGPEPYGMVYVSPTGSVKRGSLLGKDFFHADKTLYKKAEEIGFIPEDYVVIDESDAVSREIENASDVSISCENSVSSRVSNVKTALNHEDDDSENQAAHQTISIIEDDLDDFDNNDLRGPNKVLTERSVKKCSGLILNFLLGGENEVVFMKDLFGPIWECLRVDQADTNKSFGWNYERSRGGNLARTYWFVPPNSVGVTGKFGLDYFVTEEALISFILRESRSFPSALTGFNEHNDLLDKFSIKMSRAIENNITYDVVKNSSSPSSRTRRSRRVATSDDHDVQLTSPNKSSRLTSVDNKPSPHSASKGHMSSFSQKTLEGAHLLLHLNIDNNSKLDRNNGFKISEAQEKYCCIASKNGVRKLLKKRGTQKNNTEKKRDKSDWTIIEREQKKLKLMQPYSPDRSTKLSMKPGTYHMTQSPDAREGGNLSVTSYGMQAVPLDQESISPLHGLTFFTSGISDETKSMIVNLGGKVLKDISDSDISPECIFKKLFFISRPEKRRTHNYVLAAALGVPMLNVTWIFEINDLYNEYKRRVKNDVGKSIQPPSPFSSYLYTSNRLPLGLSLKNGLFILQKARHAKKWSRPGCQGSSVTPVFQDMNIAIALPKKEMEVKWSNIIRASGGNIITLSDLKRQEIIIDLVLIDVLSLPPHVLAVPSRVGKVLQFVSRMNKNNEIPTVDLSWATQCIVQRTRLDLDNDKRFLLDPKIAGKITQDNMLELFSFKSQNNTRYEVGDLVSFRRGNEKLSMGRLSSIYHNTNTRKIIIQLQLMEVHNKNELIDGGESVPCINVEEDELKEHIILLSGKDYQELGTKWIEYSSPFIQKIN